MLKGCSIRRSGPFQGFPDSFSDWPAPPLDVRHGSHLPSLIRPQHCFEVVDAGAQEHTFWVDKSSEGVLWVSRFRDAITAANPGNPACNQLSGQRAVPKVIVDATYVAPTAEWGDDDSATSSGSRGGSSLSAPVRSRPRPSVRSSFPRSTHRTPPAPSLRPCLSRARALLRSHRKKAVRPRPLTRRRSGAPSSS